MPLLRYSRGRKFSYACVAKTEVEKESLRSHEILVMNSTTVYAYMYIYFLS